MFEYSWHTRVGAEVSGNKDSVIPINKAARWRPELSGFVARIFQHEFDHLEGKTYLDRVENNADIFAESEFFKLVDGCSVIDTHKSCGFGEVSNNRTHRIGNGTD